MFLFLFLFLFQIASTLWHFAQLLSQSPQQTLIISLWMMSWCMRTSMPISDRWIWRCCTGIAKNSTKNWRLVFISCAGCYHIPVISKLDCLFISFIVPSVVLPKWFRTATEDIQVGKPCRSSSLELVSGLLGWLKAKQFCLKLWCCPLEVITV
jgi:hypothetical protein